MKSIAEQIQKIEDEDPNFTNNIKWVRLRKMQDRFILNKAKNELIELRYKKIVNEDRIKFLEKYIKENENVDL